MRALSRPLLVVTALSWIVVAFPRATTFSCPGGTAFHCQNTASCDGSAYRRISTCKLQCMNEVGPNEYQDGASCDCGPAATGGGGGGSDCGDGGICCVYPEACEEV
jgi:hypothetical protein